MFKQKIIIRSVEELGGKLDIFKMALRKANLPTLTQNLLQEQIETTLLQFERQLTSGPIQKVVADRLFEGDGYRATVCVQSGKENAIDKIKRLLGIG